MIELREITHTTLPWSSGAMGWNSAQLRKNIVVETGKMTSSGLEMITSGDSGLAMMSMPRECSALPYTCTQYCVHAVWTVIGRVTVVNKMKVDLNDNISILTCHRRVQVVSGVRLQGSTFIPNSHRTPVYIHT